MSFEHVADIRAGLAANPYELAPFLRLQAQRAAS